MKRFFLFHDKWLDYLFVVAINVSHNTQSSDIDINIFFPHERASWHRIFLLSFDKGKKFVFFYYGKIDDLNWH